MSKQELYILIAVFVLLLVMLVWIGTKAIFDMKRHKRKRIEKREQWKQQMKTKIEKQ